MKMKYWKAVLAGSMLAGGMVALSACSGSAETGVRDGNPYFRLDWDNTPKNPDPPAPDPDEDTPSNQITFNGDEYDIYGNICPTWAVNTDTGRMFYLTNCTGDLAITDPGGGGKTFTGGSSGDIADASTIGSVEIDWAGRPIYPLTPIIPGSFEDSLQDELARGFGDDALPIDPALSAFDLLTEYEMLDLDPSDPAYETTISIAWRFNAIDDHFGDVMLHLRTDQVILPPSLYNVQYEMYIKNDVDDGLPGYVRARLRGDLNAVLAYLADMGYEQITVQDELRGTEETVGANQDTRQISWNGVQVPGLFADPTPDGIN